MLSSRAGTHGRHCPCRMAYSEELAERVRGRLDTEDFVTRKMFGGLAFMVDGHLTVGVAGDRLMLRTDRDAYDALLLEEDAAEMDFTGRTMRGFLFITPGSDERLAWWIDVSLAFVHRLPPK